MNKIETLNFPRRNLGFFPTPIVEIKNLASYLSGPRLFIKRDDLTGLALGGNKTRKLEFLIAEAVAAGYDTIVTGGAEQSNHCLQTAAATAICGIECHLLLRGEPSSVPNGNLLLDILYGAQIHWAGKSLKEEKLLEIAEDLREAGKKTCVIPFGGSSSVGALGYINAVQELALQCDENRLSFSHIVFPSSSGGTHAGLIVGARLYNQSFKVIGIGIDKQEIGTLPLTEKVQALANQTATKILMAAAFSREDIDIREEYVGDGYGLVGELERDAIRLTATKEGILLDPVYTGRAMGALIAMIENKEFEKSDNILFWHTGGAAALFSYSEKLMG
jgi:L-cysteate sulfo-lyase